MKHYSLPIELQLFADEGAPQQNTTAAATTAGENSSTAPNPAGDNATAPQILYGKQTQAKPVEQPTEQRKSFRELIDGEYKEEAQEYFDKTMGRRLKKYKGYEAENAKMREILGMQNLRYGLDPNSETYLDDYKSKVEGDTKLFEDEAVAAGMSVEDYLKVKQAERIIAQNKQDAENAKHNEVVQKHIQSMIEQSESLKKQFPNFDLESELANDNFKKLVDPPSLGGVGLSLENAFKVVHYNDILSATTSNAVNQAVQMVANAKIENKNRPTENSLNGQPSVIIKDDPSKLKLEDFRRIRREYEKTGRKPTF